jgi:Alcohol dehydrogenase GroES-like domain
MRRIVHHELGEPAWVLRVEDGPSPSLGPDQVRVRLSYAGIHPGDLLGIMGSPAFGMPPPTASGERVPGFEGAGVVSEVGSKVDPALGLKEGLRVAFFPASCAWRDEPVVPASSVVPLPDPIPDEVGPQMLINMVTALTMIRAAHDSLPPDARIGVVTLLTGAGSAVERLTSRREGHQTGSKRSQRGDTHLGPAGVPRFRNGTCGLGGPRPSPGPPPRAPRSTSRSTALAGVCWATSRICWVNGPGPSSISAHAAGRRATSVYFRPVPHAQTRGTRQLDAAATGTAQSRCCARAAARARARSPVRGCRTVLAIPDR